MQHKSVDPSDLTRESSDSYGAVIARCDCFRAAQDEKGHQWLFQRRRSGMKGGKRKWDNIAFCRTRTALSALWVRYCGEVPAEILSLPEKSSGGKVRAK